MTTKLSALLQAGLVCLVQVCLANNLVTNPGFENWQNGMAQGWDLQIWNPMENITTVYEDSNKPHSGDKYLVISNNSPNTAYVIQSIPVKSQQLYEFSCWLKTERIGVNLFGATITLAGLEEYDWNIRGTQDQWGKMIFYILTGEKVTLCTIALGLGKDGQSNSGKAMFDSVSLQEVPRVTEKGAIVVKLEKNSERMNDTPSLNLAKNPGFEFWSNNLPVNWTRQTWTNPYRGSTISTGNENAHSGEKYLVIDSSLENDVIFNQDIQVEGNSLYELSCWIKTENVGDTGPGAFINIAGINDITWGLEGTHPDWEKSIIYLRTGATENNFSLSVGLGNHLKRNLGRAMFDSVSVRKVESIPDKNAVVINKGSGLLKISKAEIEPHSTLEVTLLLFFFLLNTALAVFFRIRRQTAKDYLGK